MIPNSLVFDPSIKKESTTLFPVLDRKTSGLGQMYTRHKPVFSPRYKIQLRQSGPYMEEKTDVKVVSVQTIMDPRSL